MKKYFFTAIFLILLGIIPKQTNAQNLKTCAYTTTPKIFFYSAFGKLEYDFTKSSAEIKQIARTEYSEDTVILGLATRRLISSTRLKLGSNRYGKSGFCSTPREIHVYIGSKRPTIYVSNQLEKNSCDFLLTLRHEEAHIQTTLRMLNQFIKHAPDKFKKLSVHVKPIYVKNQSEADLAYNLIQEQYSDLAKVLTAELEKEIKKEQNKIDDPKLRSLHEEVCKRHRKDDSYHQIFK